MAKTILQIKEIYSGHFQLQEILSSVLFKRASNYSGLPSIFVSSQKGTNYER